uniref:Uncharacterized protein n=1 Tax=Anopheles culicifacies TaxID=139723 RepID=A0A182M2W9_9DIPT
MMLTMSDVPTSLANENPVCLSVRQPVRHKSTSRPGRPGVVGGYAAHSAGVICFPLVALPGSWWSLRSTEKFRAHSLYQLPGFGHFRLRRSLGLTPYSGFPYRSRPAHWSVGAKRNVVRTTYNVRNTARGQRVP